MWPYYDRGICKVVKDVVEPIMEQYKPPGVIKKIYFSEFTFGDAPFRVEGEHQSISLWVGLGVLLWLINSCTVVPMLGFSAHPILLGFMWLVLRM
jgi:hypothetical protein